MYFDDASLNSIRIRSRSRSQPRRGFVVKRSSAAASTMGLLRISLLACALHGATALFGNKKKEDEDPSSYKNLAKAALNAGAQPGFDATAALDEIRNNPEVQRKMRDMMQDPEALAELSELMKDPAFKAQVDAFTSNPDVRSRVQQQGAGAFLGGEAKQPSAQMDPRDHAKLKAEADMEYEKYRSQFTGEQNAAKGLEAIVGAAKDPERLADAMRDLNDPEMMKAAHEMMADPSFQAEMQRMMQQPEMRKIVEASSSFVQELQKDPSKMAEMQQKIADMQHRAAL